MPKFTTSRAALAPALDLAFRAIARRNTIPVMSNLLVETSSGKLTITGSDLDSELSVTLDANGADCATTIPAALLRDAVKKLPDGAEIMFDVGDSSTIISSGRTRFRVQTLPATDFPRIVSGELPHRFSLAAADLKRLLDTTSFAMSSEETRYYLNGVYLHAAGNHLVAVATDGHRLARFMTGLPDGADGMPGVIVARQAAPLILGLIDGKTDVAISLSESKIEFLSGSVRLTTKLVDGTFPEYQRVIPAAHPHCWMLDCAALKAALDRVMTIAPGAGRRVGITFQPDGPVLFEVKNPDSGAANDEMDALDASGETVETGANGRYVLEMLGAMSAKAAAFRLGGAGDPIVVEPQDGPEPRPLFVLMPMRG